MTWGCRGMTPRARYLLRRIGSSPYPIARLVGQLLDRIADLGSFTFWRRFHTCAAMAWFVQIFTIPFIRPIRESIPYLVIVSLATAFSGEMAGLHGSEAQRAASGEETVSD